MNSQLLTIGLVGCELLWHYTTSPFADVIEGARFLLSEIENRFLEIPVI